MEINVICYKYTHHVSCHGDLDANKCKGLFVSNVRLTCLMMSSGQDTVCGAGRRALEANVYDPQQ